MPENALVQIKRKEIDLQTLRLQAKRDADRVVAAARGECARLRLDGKEVADAEARSLREAGLDQARREAARIRREFAERAGRLDRGDGLLRRLAEQIARVVAPRPP